MVLTFATLSLASDYLCRNRRCVTSKIQKNNFVTNSAALHRLVQADSTTTGSVYIADIGGNCDSSTEKLVQSVHETRQG